MWSVVACTASWDKGGIFFQHEQLREMFIKTNQGCFYTFFTLFFNVLMPFHDPKVFFVCCPALLGEEKGSGWKTGVGLSLQDTQPVQGCHCRVKWLAEATLWKPITQLYPSAKQGDFSGFVTDYWLLLTRQGKKRALFLRLLSVSFHELTYRVLKL